MTFSSADRELAARLEAAEAANGMAMAKAVSETGGVADVEPIAGGLAVFAGLGSPMTHALGIGLAGPVSEAELEHMEIFFRQRGSPCLIDLCPMADGSVLEFVQKRAYRPIEFNNVLVCALRPQPELGQAPAAEFTEEAGVRPAQAVEIQDWSRLVSRGFSEFIPVSDEMVAMMAATCGKSQCWFGGGSEDVAGAAMGMQGRVALFYGDATLKEARGKGWQSKLIRERLLAAQRQGCDFAMVSVLPGSTSHRNYERAGFQLMYTRVNLMGE